MTKTWNDDWRDVVNDKVMNRLDECRSTKNDIFIMAKAMYKFNSEYTINDCINRMIEWVTNWNSQYDLKISYEDYQKWIAKMS